MNFDKTTTAETPLIRIVDVSVPSLHGRVRPQ